MPSKLTRLSVALLAFAAPVCHADDNAIAWNGFLNVVGGVLKDAPIVDFSGREQIPDYQGYTDDFTFDQQTSAGLQAQKRLDDKTSITMQLYAEGDVDNYQTTVKWLYLTYAPTYHSTFRIGKIQAPVYYYSDYLNVGYAYHWISPPESVYPFDAGMNGINYVYQNTWGDLEWSGELMLGSGDDYFPIIESRVHTRKSRGLAVNLSRGDLLSFRAMVLQTEGTFEVDAINDEALADITAQATDTALEESGLPDNIIDIVRPDLLASTRAQLDNGALDLSGVSITYGDLAMRVENERWLLMTELITVQTDAYLYNDLVSKFITGGVHVGNALYHITFTRGGANPDDEVNVDRHNNTPADPNNIDDVGNVLASQIRSTLAGVFCRSQQSVSVGVRYDTSANTAVKFEVTRFKELASFNGDELGVGDNLLFRTALNATF